MVDLALDTPPTRPPTVSVVGPTFDLEELAGRKTLALFDRAAARDFVDVYALVKRYGKTLLLERAPEVDLGFDHGVFAQMLDTLARFGDSELPITAELVEDLREVFAEWAREIRADLNK